MFIRRTQTRSRISGEPYVPDARFDVTLENGHQLTAYTAGRMRRFRIRILRGDRASLELSPYDMSKGRISLRHQERRNGH